MLRFILSAVLLIPAAALADSKAMLKHVPDSAMGFVCVSSVTEVDKDLKNAITALGLEEILPTDTVSLESLLKEQMSIAEGVDKSGSIFAVIIEHKDPNIPPEMAMYAPPPIAFATYIPSTDGKALLTSMEGKQGEAGAWTVQIGPKPMHAAITASHVILSDKPEVLEKLSKSEKSILEKIGKEELASFEGSDVLMWVDIASIYPALKTQIDGFFSMMMMMSAQDPASAAVMRDSKKQIDNWLSGSEHLSIGVHLTDTNLALRSFQTAKPGTEYANQLSAMKSAPGSLLEGLPAEPFVAAGGLQINEDGADVFVESMKPLMKMVINEVGENNKENVGKITDHLEDILGMFRSARFAVATHEGDQGIFSISKVMTTTDSAKTLTTIENICTLLKSLKAPEGNQDAKQMQEAFAFKKDAEEIGGVKVSHIVIDLEKIEDIEEDELEEVTSIVGSDGMLFRVADIGDNKLAMSFGGGAAQFAKLLETSKAWKAPLADHAAVKQTAAFVPTNKSWVAYIAPDQLVTMIKNSQKAVGDEPLPIPVPEGAPALVMCTSGGDLWQQSDFVIPQATMKATKKIVKALMAIDEADSASPEAPHRAAKRDVGLVIE